MIHLFFYVYFCVANNSNVPSGDTPSEDIVVRFNITIIIIAATIIIIVIIVSQMCIKLLKFVFPL